MVPITPQRPPSPAIPDTNSSSRAQPVALTRIKEYEEPDIVAACRSGDVQWLKELLRRDACVVHQNYKSGRNEAMVTPLYMACQKGHDDIVQLLLEQRVDVNRAIHNGGTPFSVACSKERDSIVEKLLRQPGIEVNAASADGCTPLYKAAWRGHTDIVKRLLQCRAVDVNKFSGKKGCTPLHGAAYRGHQKIVALLLKHPAVDVNAKTDAGVTALHIACSEGHIGVIEQLLKIPGIDIRSCDDDGNMAIDLAARRNHREPVMSLARAMAGFGEEPDTQIAFRYAMRSKNLPWLRELLEKSPELARQRFAFYEPSHWGYPLHLATERGWLEVCELLLERGADSSAARADGATTLMLASGEGNSELTALLLSQRTIKVNAVHTSGATPLYMAAQNGHVAVVKQLLDKGADPKLKRKKNWRTWLSPLDIARKNNHQQVVKLLQAVEQKPAKVTEATPLLNPLSED